MNLFIRELRSNLIPFLVWSGALIPVHFVASIEFGIFASDPTIVEAMGQFEALYKALGSTSANITTPEGFISIMSIYIILPLSIYSGLLGSGIISKEEKNKTAEFLFTLPVTRERVLLSKIIVAILNSLLLNVVLMGTILVFYTQYEPDAMFYEFLLYTSLGAFATQMIFLSIGAGLAAVLKYYKQSGSVTIAIIISAFMINILIGFVEDLDFLKYFSPYNFFNANLMVSGEFEWINLFSTVLLIVLGLGSLFWFYPKRDLYI